MVVPQKESLAVRIRPARVSDAPHFRAWRTEPSVGRFQPIRDVPLSQIRSDVASQRMEGLHRGSGDRFQWIIEAGARPAGWITLVVGN